MFDTTDLTLPQDMRARGNGKQDTWHRQKHMNAIPFQEKEDSEHKVKPYLRDTIILYFHIKDDNSDLHWAFVVTKSWVA